MANKPVNPNRLAFLITKTVIFKREGDTTTKKWVYQRVLPRWQSFPLNEARGLQLRRHVIPSDPKTAAQLARRAWFKAGCTYWNSLTEAQKDAWIPDAKKHRTTRHAEFTREWIAAFPPMIGAQLSMPNDRADLLLGTINSAAHAALNTPNDLADTLTGDIRQSARLTLQTPNDGADTLAGYAYRRRYPSGFFIPPLSGSPGILPWGSGVYQFSGVVSTSNDTTTITSHPLPTTQTPRTVHPYATSAVSDTASLWGWGVDPTIVNSAAPHLAYIPAGNHTLTMTVTRSASLALLNNVLTMFLYRVGPSPTYTRTLLGSATATTIYSPAGQLISIVLAQPQIELAAGESIMYSFSNNARGGAASAATYTYECGNFTGSPAAQSKIDFPGLYHH